MRKILEKGDVIQMLAWPIGFASFWTVFGFGWVLGFGTGWFFIIEVIEWQTLIAGLLALGGAGWTVRTLRRQIGLQEREIHDQKKQNEDLQYRKSLAARAALPIALSELCGYTNDCYSYLRVMLPNRKPVPILPEEALASIKAAIEFVDSHSAGRLYDLLVSCQIQSSRLNSMDSPPGDEERTQRLCDMGGIRHLTESLFFFARREEDVVTVYDYFEVPAISALNRCNTRQEPSPYLDKAEEAIRRKFSVAREEDKKVHPVRGLSNINLDVRP